MKWTSERLLNAIGRIQTYERDGKRAVHKSLMVLLALSDVQCGGCGVLRFNEIEAKFNALLQEFGTTSNSSGSRAHYPFWYLKNDRIWFVADSESFMSRTGKGGNAEPQVTQLRKADASAGLLPEIVAELRSSPGLLNDAAMHIAACTFPETRRRDVLNAVGLYSVPESTPTKRDASFRQAVLREYNSICAMCGYDGRLGFTSIGIEAAHIKMVSMGGPNDVSNGIALCALHHKLFDAGAFTIAPASWTIIISKRFSGLSPAVSAMIECEVQQHRLTLPIRHENRPGSLFLEWHRSQIFVSDDA